MELRAGRRKIVIAIKATEIILIKIIVFMEIYTPKFFLRIKNLNASKCIVN